MPKDCNIRLVSYLECCKLRRRIDVFINGRELIEDELIDNPCSPLCGSSGRYEWQMHGHNFLLMGNNTMSFTPMKYRLFVDGVDEDTGQEFSAFWRTRGMIFVCVGLVFFVLSAVGFAMWPELMITNIDLAVVGLIFFIMGIIPIVRFRKTLVYENSDRIHFGHTNTYTNF